MFSVFGVVSCALPAGDYDRADAKPPLHIAFYVAIVSSVTSIIENLSRSVLTKNL